VAAPECMVVGCEASALEVSDITRDEGSQGWAHLPAMVRLCPLHADQLKDPATEWILVRGEGLYVGDGLRNLNEYIVIGVDDITGYGSGREFSSWDDNGHHIGLRVRRRGDRESTLTLVVPTKEVAKELNSKGSSGTSRPNSAPLLRRAELRETVGRLRHAVPVDRRDRRESTVVVATLSADPATLVWCQGCGCRHRQEWMGFDELGRYHCAVCGLDYSAAASV
jgi:hypothetical protein